MKENANAKSITSIIAAILLKLNDFFITDSSVNGCYFFAEIITSLFSAFDDENAFLILKNMPLFLRLPMPSKGLPSPS